MFVAQGRGSQEKFRFGLCPPYLQNTQHQHISQSSNGPNAKRRENGKDGSCEANWLMYSKEPDLYFLENKM